VADLYTLGDLATFRNRIVQILPRVVPGDVVTYAEIDPASRRIRWAPEPEVAFGLAEAGSIFARHMQGLPLFRSYRRGDGSATKISDHMTRSQFQRTPLYNEFYRRSGLEYHIAKGLPGPAGFVTAVSLLRRDRDFGERDRLLLDLLRPHLNQAYRNAQVMGTMQRELTALRGGVEALEQGLVVLDADGRAALVTTRARRWLEDYVGPVASSGLPPKLAEWVRSVRSAPSGDDAPAPRTPLILELPGRQLVVRLVSMGAEAVLMLTEHSTERRPEALAALGLSRRETEALTWVAEGKTNAEIAIILGTSVRTIDKHLERIFRKLGVETRTAAAALALALLKS
jgi:DNA-binding CsgD family transcriptional regulator